MKKPKTNVSIFYRFRWNYIKKIFRLNFYSRAVLDSITGQIWPAGPLLRTPVLDILVLQQNSFIHEFCLDFPWYRIPFVVAIAFMFMVVLYVAQSLHLIQTNLTQFKCNSYVTSTSGLKYMWMFHNTECIIISKAWADIMSDQPKICPDMIGHELWSHSRTMFCYGGFK